MHSDIHLIVYCRIPDGDHVELSQVEAERYSDETRDAIIAAHIAEAEGIAVTAADYRRWADRDGRPQCAAVTRQGPCLRAVAGGGRGVNEYDMESFLEADRHVLCKIHAW